MSVVVLPACVRTSKASRGQGTCNLQLATRANVARHVQHPSSWRLAVGASGLARLNWSQATRRERETCLYVLQRLQTCLPSTASKTARATIQFTEHTQ